MTTPLRLVDARSTLALRQWLENVYPFYLHDLSQFAPDAYRLNASGRWEPDYLPYWLEHDHCHPLVALRGDDAVGFALVGEAPFPFMSPDARFRISELFVLRAHRRSGLGRAVARAVLARLTETCELTVLAENAPALAFWRAFLSEVVRGPIVEVPGDGEVGFTFRVSPWAEADVTSL